MKKILPASGFTLIELLVVISIIAILSVVGVTVFSNVQAGARDSRRRADIEAIAKALEVNKVANASTYPALAATHFASGVIPVDSGNGSATYSVDVSTTVGAAAPAIPTVWANTSAFPEGYATVAAGSPADTATSWTVCALLETGTAPNVYCKQSSQ